jgi:hypothetical protein
MNAEVGGLVDDAQQWHVARKGRYKLERRRRKVIAGRMVPAPEVILPLSWTVFRMLRCDEAREDRPRLMPRDDVNDRRLLSLIVLHRERVRHEAFLRARH